MTPTEMENLVEDFVQDIAAAIEGEGLKLVFKRENDIREFLLDKLLPLARD